MYSEKNLKAIKSGGWYTASNFLLGALGFLTTPIFTRLMTKAEFGAFQNYLSWLYILEVVVTFNVNASLISGRFDYSKTFDRFIFSILTLGSFSCILWGLLLLIGADWIEPWLGFGREFLCWMFGYILFSTVISIYQTKERYVYQYKASVAVSLGIAVLTMLLSLVFLYTMEDKVLARVVGHALPTIAIGLALYVLLGRRDRNIDYSCWRYAISICLPYIPHLLSMTMLNSMDKIMIANICGAEFAALYALAYTCGRMGVVFLNSMNTAFGPWLADHLMAEDYSAIRHFSYRYISVFVALIFGVMLLGPEVLLILGGRPYMEAVHVLLPVMAGCLFQFLYTMFVNVEQITKQTKGMAIASVSAAVLNYILNWLCIPRFGYLAAAYTTLAGYLWLLLVHMFMVKRMGFSAVYDYRFIAGIVGGMMLIVSGVDFLYQMFSIRWCVILVYGCIMAYYLNKVWKALKAYN